MILAFLYCAATGGGSFQDPQTPTDVYSNPKLGLSFSHPSTWILENPNEAKPGRKGKRHKLDSDTVHFRVPLVGAVEDADLVVMVAQFNGSQETWQKVQTDANTDLKRTVEKQWNQEVLGVPLLLTRIAYTDNGNPKTILTGLLYNDSSSKFLFRLTGPTGDFDKAQYEFTQAMQSLRTSDNALPKAQDPDHPSAVAPVLDRGVKHTLYSPPPPPKLLLAPVAVPLVVSTKDVILRVPKGWSAEHIDGNSLELKNSQLGFPLSVKVYSVLDSDPPEDALSKACAASLAAFRDVSVRHDTPVDTNGAGCTVTSVWRLGSNEKGKLMSYDALGKSGDFYFVLSGSPKSFDAMEDQKKLLQKFLDTVSIEPRL